jgi:hypothetical protein
MSILRAITSPLSCDIRQFPGGATHKMSEFRPQYNPPQKIQAHVYPALTKCAFRTMAIEMVNVESRPLLAVAELLITENCPDISPDVFAELRQIADHFISGILTLARASGIFLEKTGTTQPVDRLSAILTVSEDPIPPRPQSGSHRDTRLHKRIRVWTDYEDRRLLCAINKFGLDDWASISKFVGNERTRAQCSQRWFRGLNPRLSKARWAPEEEQRLRELVSRYGTHSWTRISLELGNRSDAQCRYHYLQIARAGRQQQEELLAHLRKITSPQSEPVRSVPLSRSEVQVSASQRAEVKRRERLPPIKDLLSKADG